jgi:hypothetical protein
MHGKDHLSRRTHRRPRVAGMLAALMVGIAGGALSLHGAATGRAPAWRVTGPTSATASGSSRATASARASTSTSAPASASAPASRPALQADAILSKFPGNASVVTARSDARNFTVEGRVRDVRSVTVDAAGNVINPIGAAGGKTELRVVLVGRSQADDVAAHFTCRFDKATEDAAANLKPDQIVRLTGSIGGAVTAGDRFDLLNCHDLSETGPLDVGDRLVGIWRCNDVQVDGAALRKANQARGIKDADVPDANYSAPWHIDLSLRADGTLSAELVENNGPSLKRITGRCVVLKDGPSEARLRLDVQGGGPQEVTAAIEGDRLQLTLPGLADKFVLPDTHFGKLEGTMRPMDYRAFKDQTLQWLSANIAKPDDNVPKYISDAVDQAANQKQGFIFSFGAGSMRRGRIALVIGAFGKLMPVEYSDAETMASNLNRMTLSNGYLPQWGTLMVPEVKIEALTVDNRTAFDATKPLTGKISLRGLRRMIDAQYELVASTTSGLIAVDIEKPGPDTQIYDLHLDRLPGGASGPRLIVFAIGRKSKPNDLFGDNANRIISEPVPILLDIAPPK